MLVNSKHVSSCSFTFSCLSAVVDKVGGKDTQNRLAGSLLGSSCTDYETSACTDIGLYILMGASLSVMGIR